MGLDINEIMDERFKNVSEKLRDFIIQKKLPNLLALVYQKDKIVYCEKIGKADIEKNELLQLNHIFRIASMTKPIICVAALLLYEEGKFSLDDPISKFIPKASKLKVFAGISDDQIEVVELDRPVTILDLFTHTSGFIYAYHPDHPIDKQYVDILDDIRQRITTISLKEVIEAMLDIPLKHQPGLKWAYGYSTDILGYLVEVISGKPLDVFLEERIFHKLGMKDTGFYVPTDKQDRFIPFYTHDQTGDLVKQADEPKNRYLEKPGFLSGGGGLVATLSDYFNFAQMLLNRGNYNGTQLLQEDTIVLMMKDHLSSREINYEFNPEDWPVMPDIFKENIISYTNGCGFGLGVQVKLKEENIPAATNGWCGVFTTDYWVDPSNGVIGILLSQYTPLFRYPIFSDFKNLTYQVLGR
ncbi:MAG: serine hydrolase domain-containing protein [Candidatus Kariarchaeaceae archaeon]|jgi:CubicO group peptidase (beta-lactamase class C family)